MSNPYMVQIPFCNTGNKNAIQLTQHAGQDPEDATYQEGFPPVTMLNEDAGGLPPKGLDFNGIFYELSSPIAHYCRGDRIQFDATYAAAIGGYAKGWVVASNDYQKDYISLVDNNLTDPNGTNTTWAVYAGQGSVPVATSATTGTVKIVNSLASTATDAALTAAQGNVLDGRTRQATTSTLGIVRISTETQALAGVDDLTALTPSKLRSALSASGNAPIFGVRAFCTFDGSGVPSILAEGNIQSVTVSNLKFTATFKTPMPHANYAICGFAADVTNSNRSAVITMNPDMIASKTVNGFDFYARYSSNTSLNIASPLICFSIIC